MLLANYLSILMSTPLINTGQPLSICLSIILVPLLTGCTTIVGKKQGTLGTQQSRRGEPTLPLSPLSFARHLRTCHGHMLQTSCDCLAWPGHQASCSQGKRPGLTVLGGCRLRQQATALCRLWCDVVPVPRRLRRNPSSSCTG